MDQGRLEPCCTQYQVPPPISGCLTPSGPFYFSLFSSCPLIYPHLCLSSLWLCFNPSQHLFDVLVSLPLPASFCFCESFQLLPYCLSLVLYFSDHSLSLFLFLSLLPSLSLSIPLCLLPKFFFYPSYLFLISPLHLLFFHPHSPPFFSLPPIFSSLPSRFIPLSQTPLCPCGAGRYQ